MRQFRGPILAVAGCLVAAASVTACSRPSVQAPPGIEAEKIVAATDRASTGSTGTTRYYKDTMLSAKINIRPGVGAETSNSAVRTSGNSPEISRPSRLVAGLPARQVKPPGSD